MTVILNIPSNLETVLQSQAQAKGLTVEKYLLALVKYDMIAPPTGSENWTLQDALDFAGPLPEELGAACAVASQDVLGRIWNSPEDNSAWPAS